MSHQWTHSFWYALRLAKELRQKHYNFIQGKSNELDVSDMYNAWGNRPLESPGKIRYFGGKCFDEKNCQVRGVFSDAAGTFVAEWLIVDGRIFRTVLTGSNDVMDLFMKHIDPPEFD